MWKYQRTRGSWPTRAGAPSTSLFSGQFHFFEGNYLQVAAAEWQHLSLWQVRGGQKSVLAAEWQLAAAFLAFHCHLLRSSSLLSALSLTWASHTWTCMKVSFFFFFSAIEHRSLKLALPSDLEIVVDVSPSDTNKWHAQASDFSVRMSVEFAPRKSKTKSFSFLTLLKRICYIEELLLLGK